MQKNCLKNVGQTPCLRQLRFYKINIIRDFTVQYMLLSFLSSWYFVTQTQEVNQMYV
jgi:hypothetical protein